MTLKNIIFRNLKTKEYLQFKNYYRKNLDKKNIFVKKKEVFDFHFKNKSFYNLFVSIYKNKIISIQGYIPQSIYDFRLSKKEIFLSNFHATNKFPGIGKIAFLNLIKDKDFVGSTNFPKRMLEYHIKLGFKTGKMKHYFILSPFQRDFKILKNVKKKNIINSEINFNLSNLRIQEIKTSKDIKLNKKNFNKNLPKKSNKFIQNRYLSYPYFKYFCYEIYKNGIPKIVIIIRKIKVKKKNVLKIIDLFGEEKNFYILKNILVFLLKKFDSEAIDLYCYGIKDKYLKKAGFNNIDDFKDLIIPEWFNPFVRKNIDYFYAIKCTKKKSIRLFKGDGDRDRPN